jgi:hypothetical protein
VTFLYHYDTENKKTSKRSEAASWHNNVGSITSWLLIVFETQNKQEVCIENATLLQFRNYNLLHIFKILCMCCNIKTKLAKKRKTLTRKKQAKQWFGNLHFWHEN